MLFVPLQHCAQLVHIAFSERNILVAICVAFSGLGFGIKAAQLSYNHLSEEGIIKLS